MMTNGDKLLKGVKNKVGGYDLLTERDAGNEILILTGKKDRSLRYWKQLRYMANEIISALEELPDFEQPRETFVYPNAKL